MSKSKLNAVGNFLADAFLLRGAKDRRGGDRVDDDASGLDLAAEKLLEITNTSTRRKRKSIVQPTEKRVMILIEMIRCQVIVEIMSCCGCDTKIEACMSYDSTQQSVRLKKGPFLKKQILTSNICCYGY